MDKYTSPLTHRYASDEMNFLFSNTFKYTLWRKLWLALAENEKALGLNITEEQLAELRAHVNDIDFDNVHKHEKRLRHDVMAHIHAYGDCCPTARGIIHLGATSCYVTDNSDLIQIREAMTLLFAKLIELLKLLETKASKHASLPCLAWTHLQPAQPTTVGKRF
ncbi:adenylosuccinate lyase, partial [Simkania negevensis]|nr:adenylosuccinate lyase [Simkania negevensis]